MATFFCYTLYIIIFSIFRSFNTFRLVNMNEITRQREIIITSQSKMALLTNNPNLTLTIKCK